eukprot:gnl/TRDRNA2_/TRDRNA2_190448_c0_seq1.p1 gnl/TRDRNA2_/TRDRNA2_190448_c0~~gnl/TRDRNA2_/TRDRNA2_190448_c0_seq1.p1  ORF type:complete len:225 (-),score=52.12 gnl/TRDRNA2_/TRDRNA2_190448_c0_seq1:222-896(-)
MPKSKKAKVVNLTKVKKKTKEKKDALIEEVREACGKFSRLFLLSMENERNQFLQEVRKKLRPSRLICGKNKQMQLALGTQPSNECQDGVHKIAERISGPCALLFTDKTPAQVQEFVAGYHPVDFARCGATATSTVVLNRGVETLSMLSHSIEAHLRQLGLPTQLREGKIHLLGDHTVCKAGEELSADAAQVLKLMGIKQAQFALSVEAHWERGGKFEDCNMLED